MSDPLESMFDGLRGQRPPAEFASSGVVRRRGRQRARRQVALAGVVVLAVTGVGVGTVAAAMGSNGAQPPIGSPAPPTPTTPSIPPTPQQPTPAPAPTEAPDGWLLTADDLGAGQWQTGAWEPEWTEGPDRWRFENLCTGYDSADYPSLAQRYDQRTIAWTDGPFGPSDVPRWVHQIVDVFESTTSAGGNMHDTQMVLQACDGRDGRSFEIVDSDFAGDKSLLIWQRTLVEGGEPVDSYTVVVRVNAAVVTLHGYDPALGHADPDQLRELAQRVADRLR